MQVVLEVISKDTIIQLIGLNAAALFYPIQGSNCFLNILHNVENLPKHADADIEIISKNDSFGTQALATCIIVY